MEEDKDYAKGIMSVFSPKGIKSLALSLRLNAFSGKYSFDICKSMITRDFQSCNPSAQVASALIYEVIMIFKISDTSCRHFNLNQLLSVIGDIPADRAFGLLNSFPALFRAHVYVLYLEDKFSYTPDPQNPLFFPNFSPNNSHWEYYTFMVPDLFSTLVTKSKVSKSHFLLHYQNTKGAILQSSRNPSSDSVSVEKIADFFGRLDDIMIFTCSA